MTSGVFHSIPIATIAINRDRRQRRTITQSHIDALSASIREIGLIHPIVVDRDHTLVVGECRTMACKSLGWTHISAQYVDEMDPAELYFVELEENVRRSDLSWQERTMAIEEYHRLKKELDPSWRQEDTAKAMNITRESIAQHLKVAQEIKSPLVNNASTFKTAMEKTQEIQRRRDDSLMCIRNGVTHTHSPVLTTSFLTWTSSGLFNVIHCDFPYGINSDISGQNPSTYYDSTGTYEALCSALRNGLNTFCAPNAHMIFWFSTSAYTETLRFLQTLEGFRFDEVPLVWYKSDNRGIVPDPYRRPRRVYETAFFGWRGDARVVTPRGNVFSSPTTRDRHPHEKSEEAIHHFFSMFVDTSSRVLDPTCGSGSALRAARRLGATVLGLEIDPSFADAARRSLEETGSGHV